MKIPGYLKADKVALNHYKQLLKITEWKSHHLPLLETLATIFSQMQKVNANIIKEGVIVQYEDRYGNTQTKVNDNLKALDLLNKQYNTICSRLNIVDFASVEGNNLDSDNDEYADIINNILKG